MLTATVALFATFLVFSAVLCGLPADRGLSVTFVNETGSDIEVTVVGSEDGPPQTFRMPAGGQRGGSWLYPRPANDRRVVVSASDARGNEIFCMRVTYEDLRDTAQLIYIRAGVRECA